MKGIYPTEKEIIDELDNYIFDVKAKYAVLLNGTWGSGKTCFIKNYISYLQKKFEENKKSNEYKKPVYISLYGINNISEIKNELLLSSVKNEKVQQSLQIISSALKIGSNIFFGKTFIKYSDKKLDNLLNNFYKFENLIVVFDDLERCGLNVNYVLGYINELVEHENVKVILIADEEKIGRLNYDNNLELKYMTVLSEKFNPEVKKSNELIANKDSRENEKTTYTKDKIIQQAKDLFNENNLYNEMKEKIIGRTISFRSDINNIYISFILDIITNNDAKEIASKNEEYFLKQLEYNNYYNLRTVQFILQIFDNLVEKTVNIINLKDMKEDYLENLFFYCIICSIKFKSEGKLNTWQTKKELETIYIENQPISSPYKNNVIALKFVDDYLLYSAIDEKRIKCVLEEYKEISTSEPTDPKDPLNRLKKWWLIPEVELIELIDILIDNIKNNKYRLELYSKIVIFLSHAEEIGICKDKINDAIENLKKNIKNKTVVGTYYEDRILDVPPETAKIYDENISAIRSLIKDKENSDNKKEIDSILKKEEWGIELRNYSKKNHSNFLEDKSYASILNVTLIIENIKSKNIEQIYEFLYALQEVYHFSNINELYQKDKEVLKNLSSELTTLSKSEEIDKVKKYAINTVIKYLDKVISNL